MKIIDKTPLVDSKGQFNLVARLQGSLTHGFNWPAELEAQSKVIAQMERVLEKGFVLIRNHTLPGSEVVIPLILVGTNGVTVLYVTNVKGFFEAKGDQWNTIVNGRAQPARINLLTRVIRYARAVQVFLERQGIPLPAIVEGVLITADPGAHVESMRPIARVVMSDAVKPFANSLLQAQAVWRADLVYDFADRIVNPRPPQEVVPAAPLPPAQATPAARAQAIFTASEQVKPFDTNDLGFAFEENASPMEIAEGDQPVAVPAAAAGRGRILGMTFSQVLILGILLLCEICIVIGFAGLMLTNR